MVGHEGPVSSLFFSPTKATLVSGSWDKTVRMWDVYDSTAPKESLEIGSDGMYFNFVCLCYKTILGYI